MKHTKPLEIGLVSILFGFAISIVLVAAQYYIHELGHVILGYMSNLLRGHFPTGLSWPIWNNSLGIPVPTQTHFDQIINNRTFALAGPLFTALYAVALSGCSIYVMTRLKLSKIKQYFLGMLTIVMAALFLLHTIIGDVLFGTDNWKLDGTTILDYSKHPYLESFMNSSDLVLILVIGLLAAILIYQTIKKEF